MEPTKWKCNYSKVYTFFLYDVHITDVVAIKRGGFGSSQSRPIYLDNVVCNGSEETISQCTYAASSEVNCDHSEDAGVICGGLLTNTWIHM